MSRKCCSKLRFQNDCEGRTEEEGASTFLRLPAITIEMHPETFEGS
jgi:hypothetical protein